MSRPHIGALAVVVLLQWHTPVGAQMACAADREKFCPDVRMGGGRLAACLRQHESELSEGCKRVLPGAASGAAASGDDTRAECRADALKLCPDAIGNPPKMKTCMQEHAAQLSEGCKTALIAHGK